MKYVMLAAVLLLSGCFSSESKVNRDPSAEKKAKKHFQWCTCNFNACLGERKVSCMSIIRCKNTTAADYAQTVGNRKALLVIDEHRFCINPMEGYLQGGN